jgi:hypothetical protein
MIVWWKAKAKVKVYGNIYLMQQSSLELIS